jgi:hypothetical protein
VRNRNHGNCIINHGSTCLADQVWKLIGGFGALPDRLPYIPKCELGEGGRTRRLASPDGSTVVERLMAFDERGRSYTYDILQAPFPVTDSDFNQSPSRQRLADCFGKPEHGTELFSQERRIVTRLLPEAGAVHMRTHPQQARRMRNEPL